MTIITVANMKGGVGKSTTATILAEMSAQAGKRTLLVDMDTQQDALELVSLPDDDGNSRPVFDNLTCQSCTDAAPDPAKIKDFDVVIVDTPPKADAAIIRKTLAVSQAVVVPFQFGKLELAGVANIFDLIPSDGRLFVFPLHLISPLESASDKSLDNDAAEFFKGYGIERDEVLAWPMRRQIKNNVASYKPFHYGLRQEDREVYKRSFETIMKTLKEIK